MKLILSLFFPISFSVVLAGSLAANDFASHPYFSKIIGEWRGKGTLTNADGEDTAIQEDWTAKVNDEGGFSIEGDRIWGEESQQFRWVFSVNAATELYECEYWHTGMDEPMRFQVSLSDDGVELSAPIGEGELSVKNKFKEEKLIGKISLQGSDGQENLAGKVVHNKKK
jgi:hypothetical protein